MSFRAYPEYLSAQTEWFKQIPMSWTIGRLGYECETIVPMRDKPASLNGDIPWVRIEDFDGKFIGCSKSGQGVTSDIVQEMNLKVLPVGAVLCSCSCNMGATAIVRAPIVTNQTFIGIVPGQEYISDYIYYFFNAAAEHLNSIGAGAIQTYLSRDDFRQLRLPKPPLSEQNCISRFLDRETAKIDALVAEQEQFITLLKEKRQAVISHAVTKGLDPSAPMKDSGVAWLGEVPEHWWATTLRRCTRSVETGGTPSITPSNEEVEDGVNWFTPGDFNEGLSLENSARQIPAAAVESGDAKVFPAGAVLIVSIGATLGKVGLIMQAASANQQINAVIPAAGINSLFLAFSLSVRVDAMKFLSNASTIGIMNQEKTKDIPVAIPPASEQIDIADHLTRSCARFDALIKEATSTMTLLQERRSALISAAVTGQIDVRGLAPALEQAA